MKYISTGFTELDRTFGGIKTGELVVIASRPAMGKTTLLSNIFANNVIEAKFKNFPIRCAYFSFEHNVGMVWENTASRICKFNFGNGTLNKDELYSAEKMDKVFDLLNKMQNEGKIGLYENDGPDATLFYIALNAAEQKYKSGLDVVFIDSFDMLSLYDGSGKTIIANRLKELAEKLNIAIIVTTQFTRRQRYGYSLEDINLQLVRMADKIIFLRRLDVTATEEEIISGHIKRGESAITVMKNIGGQYGYEKVCFDYGNGGFFNYPKSESLY